MRRVFMELPAFTRLVVGKEMSDRQVAGIQDGILNGGGKTISRTGGVKKIRYEGEGRGKSGGWRVLFADYDQYEVTVLIWAFPKNEQAELTESQKKTVRALKAELDREIRVKYGEKE
jgi:mRNA-degrading endonuclease RelE of RelBE toxin-antitoxin system